MLSPAEVNRATLSARRQIHAWRDDLRKGASPSSILPALLLVMDMLTCLRDEAPEAKVPVIDRLLDDCEVLRKRCEN